MFNKVILVGRLTADPELRQTPSGISSCRFSVAVDRGYKDKNTGERQADFINVVAWRQTAEFVSRYFSKGRVIIVEGSLRNNNYTDNNGVKHYSMDVYADNISFGGDSKPNSANNSGTDDGNFQYSRPAAQTSINNAPTNNTPYTATPHTTNAASESIQIGDLSDFETLTSENEILNDGNVPF